MPFLGSRQFDQDSAPRSWSLKLRSMRSLYQDRDHGWGPLLWWLYLGFFFVQPAVDHVSRTKWALDVLGALIFLMLYLGIFLLERPLTFVHVGGMLLLGVLYFPFNPGGCTFFIFAAAMMPFWSRPRLARLRDSGLSRPLPRLKGCGCTWAGGACFGRQAFQCSSAPGISSSPSATA